MKRFKFLPIIYFIVFQGCVYEPNEKFIPKINENPEFPDIQVLNPNIYNDTIFVYFYETNFTFTSNNRKILAAKFYINELECFYDSEESSTYKVFPGDIEEGVHELRVELVTSSGTGSIADQTGYEGSVLSRSWVLVYNTDRKPLIKAEANNGRLKVSWPFYKGTDFKEFEISKSAGPSIYHDLGKKSTLSFTDSTYVGEGARYIVWLRTTNDELQFWGDIELEKEFPKIMIKRLSDNYRVYWQKSKYYNAVYEQTLYKEIDYVENELYRTNNVNDTSCSINNIKFGDLINFRLHLTPLEGNQHYNNQYVSFDYEMDLYAGDSYYDHNLNIENICKTGEKEFIFEARDSLVRYSLEVGTVIEKHVFPGCNTHCFFNMGSSPGGTYLTSYSLSNSDIRLTTSNNFSNYYVTNLTHLSGNYVPGIPVSDNGIGIVTSMTGGFYLYDLINDVQLAYYNKGLTYSDLGRKISINGDYVFIQDDSLRVLNYKNNTFKTIWQSQLYMNPTEYFSFHGINPEQLVIWDGSIFAVKRCDDFTDLTNFSLTDEAILDIDYYNAQILSYSSGSLFIRSILDGNLLYEVPINFNPTINYDQCYLINNTIVSENGVLYYLN